MASEDVEKIKDRLNITDIVGQYVQLKKAGRNYTARCPFHKEKTPSFMVSPERGTYMCFGCGERGDVFSFVQKMEGSDFPTVLRELAEKAGVKLQREFTQNSENKEKQSRLQEVLQSATRFYEAELRGNASARHYLETRGVANETSAAWKLGYAPARWQELCEHLADLGFAKDDMVEAGLAVRSEKKPGELYDRFRGRIMFPISDTGGKVIGFSGRFFEKVEGSKEEGEPAKYVNSPETPLFKKSKTLYGLDRARGPIRKLDCILLVEGQFDLILSHQSGLPFTVALSGTALTEEHLTMLSRLSKRLVLALDADQAGIRSGLKSTLMAIQKGFEVKVPVFPEGKDPADVARENPELLKAAVRTSKPAVEFFLDVLRQEAKDERAYQKLVEHSVLPLIAAMESSIEQAHYTKMVAERLGVPEAAVRIEVGKHPLGVASEPVEVPISGSNEPTLAPMEKKIGMLLSSFPQESEVYARLVELVGTERVAALAEQVASHAEALRFRFEAELGEHTSDKTVAEDMLRDIGRQVEKERFKMKFL